MDNDHRDQISVEKPHNPEMGGLITGLVLCALGLGLMLFPLVAEVDRMGFGYTLITFGVFILIAGLVTTWMFGVRAAELNKLLAGGACWRTGRTRRSVLPKTWRKCALTGWQPTVACCWLWRFSS